MQPGADFLDNEVGKSTSIVFAAIEKSGIGGADKRCSGAGRVLFIASDEIIFFSLFASSFGTDDGAGIDKVFKRAIGADDGADIAPFHDKRSGEAKLTLEIYEVLAKLGQCGYWGDSGIHFGKAGMRGEIPYPLAKGNFLARYFSMKIYFLKELFHAGTRGGIVTCLEGQESESTIHSSGIDVDVLKVVGHESSDSAFS